MAPRDLIPINSSYWMGKPFGCTCPDGAYWSVIPPYCPIHNPGRRTLPPMVPYPVPYPVYMPVVTTKSYTTSTDPTPKPKPEGEAMRAEDV